jgi:hypothetical protein
MNNRLNLNSNQISIINLLNHIYNNNNRMIENLSISNAEIQQMMNDIIYQGRQNNPRIQRHRNRNYNQYAANVHLINNMDDFDMNQLSYIIDFIDPIVLDSNHNHNHNNNNNNNTSRRSNAYSRILRSFLDPVEVYPTPAQIENACVVLRYGDIDQPINNSCPISLDPFYSNDQVTMIRHCSHIFKTTEIQSWFRTNVCCPVCRYDIRNYVRQNETTNINSSSSSSSSSREPPQPQTTSTRNISRENNSSTERNNRRTSGTNHFSSLSSNMQGMYQLNDLVTAILNGGLSTDVSNNLFFERV